MLETSFFGVRAALAQNCELLGGKSAQNERTKREAKYGVIWEK
jgi:hypothetical protein